MLTVKLNGLDYPLATSLRVAYAVQGQHNHKPYSKVFQDIGDMRIEEQIGILFCAFQIANPNEKMKQSEFLAYFLDNYKIKQILDLLKDLIGEIMGVDPDEMNADAEKSSGSASVESLDLGPQGN